MKTDTFLKLPQAKQREILDVSARVFAEKGYFQAGIAEICEKAKISNGALYKYFRNKRGLFITVAGRMIDLMLEISQQIAVESISIWDKLQRVFEAVIPFITEYRDYFVIYMDLGSPSMDSFACELSDSFERETALFFSQMIEEAKSSGEVRKEVATATAVYLIDNHLMLFSFSCVSEHYNRRFHQYFGTDSGTVHEERKIDIMMRSFRQLLQADNR